MKQKDILIKSIIKVQDYTNKLYMIKNKNYIVTVGAMTYRQYNSIGVKGLYRILSQMLQNEKNNSSKNYYEKMIKECL